jgi:hypothetical protein
VQGSEEPGARGSTIWGAKLSSEGSPRRERRGYPPVPDMPGVQKFRLTQFPFSLLYINRADCLWVVAVTHGSRKPGYWKQRVV